MTIILFYQSLCAAENELIHLFFYLKMNNLNKNVTKWHKEWQLNELNDNYIESIQQYAK